jgi:hypothetical protein
MFLDQRDPYGYVEIRGHAELTEEGGAELINQLSVKYTGDAYHWDSPDVVRVVIRVIPEKVMTFG